MQSEQKAAKHRIKLLETSLQESQSQLQGQMDSNRLMRIEAQDMNEKLVGYAYVILALKIPISHAPKRHPEMHTCPSLL